MNQQYSLLTHIYIRELNDLTLKFNRQVTF